MKHALVLAALAASVTAQAAPTWAQISFTGTTTPAPTRRAGAMAFDAVTNKLIAYGGISVAPSAILNQTWSYGPAGTALTWTQLAPTGSPPARWGHRMVRNTDNNRLITFGGRSPNIGSFSNDTWEYLGSATGGSWTQTFAPNPNSIVQPSARYLYGLAYDDVRHVAILFGGSNATTTFGDTWEYNGTTWTQRAFPPQSTPSPREDMVLVYDAALNRTVLFGGFDPNTNAPLGDTWLYDGNAWSLQIAQGPTPSPRFSGSAVYDLIRKRTVMHGGYDGLNSSTQTFQFAGDSWQLIAGTAPLPPNSTEAYAGYDPVRRKFVLQGGFGTGFTAQTWELNVAATGPGQPGIFGTFTPGCSQFAVLPTLNGTTPTLNQAMTLTFGNLPQTAGFVTVVLAVVGTSNQTWGAIPLPFNLGVPGIGLSTCDLHVSADFIGATDIAVPDPVPTTATTTFVLAIPNTASLINSVFYTQGIQLDIPLATGDLLFSGTSPAGRLVIGN